MDCIAEQDRIFAKDLLVFSKEDSRKYCFSFGVKAMGRSAWRDEGGFDYLFRNVDDFHNERIFAFDQQ